MSAIEPSALDHCETHGDCGGAQVQNRNAHEKQETPASCNTTDDSTHISTKSELTRCNSMTETKHRTLESAR